MRKTNFTEILIAVLIVLCVTFIFIGTSAASLNDGLVAYYPFNGNANDESGNSNNCNVFGATLIEDKNGIPNSAYSFDGIDDYMNCGADATFNLNQEITVSAWVKLRSLADAVIASKWKTRSGWSGSWVLSASNATSFPSFGVAADGWNLTALTSDVPIELDTYNHIAGVYSITDNLLRIYVNGKEGGTTGGPGGLAISNSDVLIGALRYTITSGRRERYINGVLDDVRIYNRALSETEIQELYIEDFKELLYTAVKPCRIVDTRKTSSGIIRANSDRDFRVYGSVGGQGGNSAGCPSPGGEPYATHINMVAVNPTGKGNLQAFPVGAKAGAGLSVNYNTIDTNLANAGSVKTVTGSGADITVASNFSSAHAVIDVLGYYYPDDGFYYTPVDPCRIVDTRKTTAGIIDADTERSFRVFGPVGDQGGNPGGCPSPIGAPSAAHLNMVAVDPSNKGNLQAYPVGAGAGAGLSVNYNTIDTNLANAGTVKTVIGAGPDISVASNFSSADTVIDVLGYYSEEEDLAYTPVTPCRIVDTRKTSAGIIYANTQRCFRVFGSVSSQGGNSGGCSSPLGQPLATHINMVAVDPTGKGNLQAFPVGARTGAGLSVNYNAIDTNLANAGTVKTVTGAGPELCVTSNFSSSHAVIDVLGYYYSAP